MNPKQQPVIYCFRHDLRIADNPGFYAAAESGRPILPCFIHDRQTSGNWRTGAAGRWWLHHSLSDLQNNLQRLGGYLVLRSGARAEQVLHLAQETGAAAVYWSRAYEPYSVKAELELNNALRQSGIGAKSFAGYLMFEPEQIRTQSNGPYKVFTPYWKACSQQLGHLHSPLPSPEKPIFHQALLPSEKLTDWRLLPTEPDWAGGLRESWSPGEQGAWQRLDTFLAEALADYPNNRDIPALAGTSKLSPHLHFGEISPRQIWQAVLSLTAVDSRLQQGADSFLRELGWREFSYHLLYHWPDIPDQPFRMQFARFPWREDTELLCAWQQGRTGIPLVDAGMRELWHTGWMHNRVRMIAASLLVKNLLQPWQAGEAWFWDTLVDADLANNAAGWQWVAGSGADAAPYFRVFNPVTQSEKFDPDGTYIRRWIPELDSLAGMYIHAPWTAPAAALKRAGIRLGKTYPYPIVDLQTSRLRALAAYKNLMT